MLGPLSYADALAILRSHVDRSWLDDFTSTPDGAATINAVLDIFVAEDQRDAAAAASLLVRYAPDRIGAPASRATFATTTLAITRRRQSTVDHVLPAGTQVQTSDGHIYLTDAPVTFPRGEHDTPHTVTATAKVAGYPGMIPPGEISQFVRLANGSTGVGTAITWVGAPGFDQLSLVGSSPSPDPFRATNIGLYIEITSVASLAFQANVGLQLRLASLGGGGQESWTAVGEPEPLGTYAFTQWVTGSQAFTWAMRDWDDLGFSVTNTTAVVGGLNPVLDLRAAERGRAALTSEGTESLRARLLLKPQKPTPLGMLRKLIVAAKPYGLLRKDIQIYELGATAPDSVDPYAVNFPASCGFISDLHCADMSTPVTPDGMAKASPTYATLSPWFNPGLSLVQPEWPPFCAVASLAVPVGLPAPQVAALDVAAFAALKHGRPPGALVQLFQQQQWGYP